MIRYAVVGDLHFRANKKYVSDSMGYFKTYAEALARMKELHSSFGYFIYKIDATESVRGLNQKYGHCPYKNHLGYLVLETIRSYLPYEGCVI